ncbi:MAG: UPF0182 family protein [Elusimicrobia bacterium]|nr:UPF0182 family protein [Elusimicrobiota bacterium]
MTGALLVLILVTAGFYATGSTLQPDNFTFRFSPRGLRHISVLAGLFILVRAWGYRLAMYELLNSPVGIVYGAGYTDVYATLPGLKILFVIAIIAALILILGKNVKVFAGVLLAWAGSSLILLQAYPLLLQRFRVDPNELEFEKEFIGHNIEMTRVAYGLDAVKEKNFVIENTLDSDALKKNWDIISNIRLWDYRPKLSVFRELQELRPYYNFLEVDVDRYEIDGDYRQVMISAREINKDKLPSRTWINEKLVYTHGYGGVMTSVSEVSSEGGPEYFMKDIPPETVSGLKIDNPAIYYGESRDEYVIANSRVKEFDYVHEDENVFVHYEGKGGVPLNGFFRKVFYALRFGEFKILLSEDLKPESRIMYYRNIRERVRKVAPFLIYDSDPYLILEKGQFFWIQDAYTFTNRFPYSEPVGNLGNYFRNSVKVVIDAYNGDMKFYLMETDEPLSAALSAIYSDLFIPAAEMPDYIRRHIRYPEDLFKIQADLLRTYHMRDPVVFYNKEDLWDIPYEHYSGRTILMEPYYAFYCFEDTGDPEFVLMLPFTPTTRNNMISWLAARSDGDYYGEMILYRFPPDQLVYGPHQIESEIDSDDAISQLVTLWSQSGSRVIRGNLIVIPVENSLLYIEPLYIEAEAVRIPRLRRIIASYNGRIVMGATLKSALTELIGEYATSSDRRIKMLETGKEDTLARGLRELAGQASEVYEEMLKNQRAGDWAAYGEKLAELEKIILKMKESTD